MKFVCLNNGILVGQEGEDIYIADVTDPVWRKVVMAEGSPLDACVEKKDVYTVAVVSGREYYEKLLALNAAEGYPFKLFWYQDHKIYARSRRRFHAYISAHGTTSPVSSFENVPLREDAMPLYWRGILRDLLPEGWIHLKTAPIPEGT